MDEESQWITHFPFITYILHELVKTKENVEETYNFVCPGVYVCP